MTVFYMSTYDPNTAEKHENLWKVLNQAHEREINSQYEIVVASMGQIYFNTRYHLRAANDVRITRNGPTQEIVYGAEGGTVLKLKADKNFVTTHSSYKITTKGDEDYTTFMLQYTYMGIYHEQKMGLTLTSSFSKSALTMGSSVLTNVGLKLSTSVLNTKFYLGATLCVPLIRMIVQLLASKNVFTEDQLNMIKVSNSDYIQSKGGWEVYKSTFLQEKYTKRMIL